MYNAYNHTHMVISFSENDGIQTDTFRGFHEAEAFAEGLGEEGGFSDIYICQILQRVACSPALPEDFGVRPGIDYPATLTGLRAPHAPAA